MNCFQVNHKNIIREFRTHSLYSFDPLIMNIKSPNEKTCVYYFTRDDLITHQNEVFLYEKLLMQAKDAFSSKK